jgi:hypothetical protein
MADLTEEYARMHGKDKRFPGYSICDYRKPITDLVLARRPFRLLDYGCGKGMQYLARRLHDSWGGMLPYCYDPGVRQLAELPEGTFGGVLCADVLEHNEREDIDDTLDRLFGYVEPDGFLFLVISCRPTRKRLGDGRDVHVTIEPPSWWKGKINSAAFRKGSRKVLLSVHFDVAGHFDEPETPWEAWV